MRIIGLSGFARSGKDEVARILVEQHGFQRVAFADKLREMLYALNPVIEVEVSHSPAKGMRNRLLRRFDLSRKYVYVKDVIDEYGWGGYKETPYGDEIRRLLQRLGTEAGRETLWDTIWIDAALNGLGENAKVVVSDARFFNEFDAIRERGGKVWRIERPGVGPANEHASEMEAVSYPDFSMTLNNDGTLEDLAKLVETIYTYRDIR